MATILSANHMNLLDLVKSQNYDGDRIKFLGELLLEDNFMQVCPWAPTSNGMVHKGLKASKLGGGSTLQINGGYSSIRSDSQQTSKNTVMFGAISKVDDKLLRNGTAEQKFKVRQTQDIMNETGFIQSFVEKLFYGAAADDPDGFDGLATMRNSKANPYFYDGGYAVADSATSLYMCEFGQKGIMLRHPGEGQAAFSMKDLGLIMEKTDDKKDILYWNTLFEISSLLDVFDERAFLRYGNLDPTTASIDPAKFIAMRNKLPSVGKNAAAFVDRSLKTQFEVQLLDKANVNYTRHDIENYGEVIRFMGVDILLQDCISDTEALIS